MNKTFLSNYLIFIAFLALNACTSNLYSLPDPPPKSEWISDGAEPDAETRQQNLRYLEARTAALQLFSAINTHNVQEAQPLLAQATIEWLTENGEVSLHDALKPLTQEEKDNDSRIDPIVDLLSADLSKVTDAVPGIDENESTERVELLSRLPNGTYQKIVMIQESGGWKLLRTEKPTPITPSAQK